MTQIFKNRFDLTTKIITGIIILIFSGVTGLLLYDKLEWYFLVPQVLLFVSIVFFSWAYHPQNYSIENSVLHINRYFKQIAIPLESITEIESIEKSMLSGSIRLLGSGGMFGYYGLFQNRKLGKYHCYVTDCKKLIRIKTKDKTYIVSPDDIEGFKQNLTQNSNLYPI